MEISSVIAQVRCSVSGFCNTAQKNVPIRYFDVVFLENETKKKREKIQGQCSLKAHMHESWHFCAKIII